MVNSRSWNHHITPLQDGTKPSEKKKEKLACHSLCEGLAIYSWVKVAGQREGGEGQNMSLHAAMHDSLMYTWSCGQAASCRRNADLNLCDVLSQDFLP